MDWLKCKRCPRVFNSGSSATTHYLTTHSSGGTVELQPDVEGSLGYTTIHFPSVSISLTKIDSPKPKRKIDTTKESHKPEEIKLDNLGASEIEKVVTSWFPQRKGTTCNKRGGRCDEQRDDTSDSEYLPASEGEEDEKQKDGSYGVNNNRHKSGTRGTVVIPRVNADGGVKKHIVLNKARASPHSSKKFDCPECGKWFAHSNNVRRHVKNVHDNKEKPAGGFKKDRELNKVHARFQANKKLGDFTCSECGMGFVHSDSLRSHMKRVHGKNISIRINRSRLSGEYPCPLCDSVMRNKQTYKDHLKLHLPGNPYTCIFNGCRKVFLNRYHLNVHRQIHTGIETWHQCSYCSNMVRRLRDIRRHVKSEHPNSPCAYTVVHKQKVDGKMRPDDDVRRIDVGSIDLSDGAVQSSSVCNTVIKEEEVDNMHSEGKKVGCTVSEGNFTKTASLLLDQEIKKHPEVIQNLRGLWKRRSKTYKCNLCPWFGLSHNWFLRHVQKEHEGVGRDSNTRAIKRYKCRLPSCGADYSTVDGLRSHLRRMHLQQYNFDKLYAASFKTGFHCRRNKKVLRCSKCDWIGITQTCLKRHRCGKNMK